MRFDPPRMRRLPAFVAALCLVVAVGCGDDGPRLQRAGGVVTLDGAPLPEVNVQFQPSEGKISMGTTDAEGKFQLSTNSPGDGVMPGKYRAAVTSNEPPPPMPGTPEAAAAGRPKLRFPPHYRSVDTSGLEYEVTADGDNNFAVELKSGR